MGKLIKEKQRLKKFMENIYEGQLPEEIFKYEYKQPTYYVGSVLYEDITKSGEEYIENCKNKNNAK